MVRVSERPHKLPLENTDLGIHDNREVKSRESKESGFLMTENYIVGVIKYLTIYYYRSRKVTPRRICWQCLSG